MDKKIKQIEYARGNEGSYRLFALTDDGSVVFKFVGHDETGEEEHENNGLSTLGELTALNYGLMTISNAKHRLYGAAQDSENFAQEKNAIYGVIDDLDAGLKRIATLIRQEKLNE